jgi:hypothetical protein
VKLIFNLIRISLVSPRNLVLFFCLLDFWWRGCGRSRTAPLYYLNWQFVPRFRFSRFTLGEHPKASPRGAYQTLELKYVNVQSCYNRNKCITVHSLQSRLIIIPMKLTNYEYLHCINLITQQYNVLEKANKLLRILTFFVALLSLLILDIK